MRSERNFRQHQTRHPMLDILLLLAGGAAILAMDGYAALCARI
jgi:hypothetical protein